MESRRAAEDDEELWAPIRRGWCLGSDAFKEQLLEGLEGQLGEHHAGDLRREHGEGRAERIIAEALGRLGWTEADVVQRRKTSAEKLELAARLRRETTLSVKWIAARVHLGTSKSANRNLHRWMKDHPPSPEAEPGRPLAPPAEGQEGQARKMPHTMG